MSEQEQEQPKGKQLGTMSPNVTVKLNPCEHCQTAHPVVCVPIHPDQRVQDGPTHRGTCAVSGKPIDIRVAAFARQQK